jgi:hypothetical protein
MLALTDFLGFNTLRNQCGWALVILIASVQSVNLFSLLSKVFFKLKPYFLKIECKKSTDKYGVEPTTSE